MKNNLVNFLSTSVLGVGLATNACANETVLYENSFQSFIVGSEWTSTNPYSWGIVDTLNPSDGDRKFLGYFGGNNITTLTIRNIPSNVTELKLEFDAYLLWSWDGNDIRTMNGVLVGPDIFGYQYGDGTLPNSRNEWTFSHGNETIGQSYCESSSYSCLPTTGAEERYTLGYRFQITPMSPDLSTTTNAPMDSVYRLMWQGTHTGGDTATFSFYSRGLQIRQDLSFAYLDEAWGLDNVRVTALTPVPEPDTLTSMIAGSFLLAGWKLNKRRKK